MSQIQWFPGHMAKSIRQIKETLKLVDLVMIVLDARIPYASMNPELLKIVTGKPTLILFNKADMADLKILKKWEKYYQEQGFYTLLITATNKKSLSQIYPLVKDVILKDYVTKILKKGRTLAPFKTMILGIPNVGKSTLINQLGNRKVAKVENRPGVTQNLAWTRLKDDFELLDTPGILWPKFGDDVKYQLAITGAIKDDLMPLDDVVIFALKYLSKNYPDRLTKRYSLDLSQTPHEMLIEIGRRHGALLKGDEIDFDRVYAIILKDIRQLRLGGLCFETPV